MKKLLLFFVGLLFVQFSFAQWTYSTNTFIGAGNPGGLNTDTDANLTGWTAMSTGNQPANIWSSTAAIPFAFDFYGMPVTHLKASQNGLITFDTTTVALPGANDNLPSASLPPMSVATFWDEFTAAPNTGTNDVIYSKTFGTAPNRQFWIRYHSFEMGNPSLSFVYLAMVLEETTNKIYVVDLYSTTPNASGATVGVQLDGTTAVQIGDNTTPVGGNGSGNADNDVYEFCPLLLVNDDAGMASLVNPPIPLTAGMQNVDVTIQNYGINTLGSATINWSIDGTVQTAFNYATPLAPGAVSATVTLGTYNFPAGTTDLKFWTSSPNGVADGNAANDTLEISACTALAGTYTIGGASPDYATFTDATAALASCGVGGAVTFNVAAGTYSENVVITPVLGASATNIITFDGGTAAGSIIDWDGTGGQPTFYLNGADYVTLQNLTIRNTGTTDAWGVRLADTASYNIVDNCLIEMNSTAVTDAEGISVSAEPFTGGFNEALNAVHCTFSNNTITGGSAGIHIEGAPITPYLSVGHVIMNNTITGQDDQGIYTDNQDSILISGNTIVTVGTAADGIYNFDVQNYTIIGNNVNVADWGIYISDGNFDYAVTDMSLIANNMVVSSGDDALYLDDVEMTNVFHNTTVGTEGAYFNDLITVDIRNNIFTSTTGKAVDFLDATSGITGLVFDFNDLYTGGTNLADDGTTTYTDLASWQAGSPAINGNSISIDPSFVAVDDLHVTNSLLNDLGDNSVGILVDIDGEARPQAPSTVVDMGADEFTPTSNDVGVTSMASPVLPLAAGLQNVEVTIENFGIVTLNTANINWTINGMLQTQFNYTGTLAPGTGSAPILIGTYNFPMGTTDLVFWTSEPNGASDGSNINDTLAISVCTSLSGVYTIGGATPDYLTFSDAAVDLVSCGVSGPVTFNVTPGTYSENMELTPILGASATNTITFDGGTAAGSIIDWDGTGGQPTVYLNGVDYVTLQNLTIRNTGTADVWGVRLADTASYDIVDNCIIEITPTVLFDADGISASAEPFTGGFNEGLNAHHCTFSNNTITGGSVGIHIEGTPTAVIPYPSIGNVIINNTITGQDDQGIFTDNQDSTIISGNTIATAGNFADGIYNFDMQNYTITGNNVNVADWGIYVSDGNFDYAVTGMSLIANNMVTSTSDDALYLDDVEMTNVFHNSTIGTEGAYFNDLNTVDIRNNIFTSTSGKAVDFLDATSGITGLVFDYNALYTSGGSLADDGTTTYTDLATWQAASTAINANSISADPIFVGATDLHVLSPAVNDVGDNSVGIALDIDGDARPQAPSTTVDIGADEFTPLSDDALVTTLLTPAGGCGDSMTLVSVIFSNQALNTITSMPVTADITGSITTTLSATYTGSVPFGQLDTIELGMLNTVQGGTYDISAYTQLAGDQDPSNDTAMFSISREPSVPPTAIQLMDLCSGDSTQLVAQGIGVIEWYDAPTGGTLLASGDTLQTSALPASATYYVGYGLVSDSLETTFAGGSGCGAGNMFDLTSVGQVDINGFTISPFFASGVDSVKIWYIPNGTYVGNETNQAAWTLLDAQQFTSVGTAVPVFVPVSALSVPGGSTYAIYVEYNATYTASALTIGNDDMSVTAGIGLCSPFSGTNNPRTFNGRIHYTRTPCTLDRTAVIATVTDAALANFNETSLELTATFTDLSTGADSVYYDYGDGTTGSDSMHTYPSAGMYNVCQIASNDCGIDTACIAVTITCTAPTAGFTSASVELEVTLTDASTDADSVSYDYGDGTTGSDATHTYAEAGNYTVCQIAYNACTTDSTCSEIAITCTAPTAAFSLEQDGSDITLTGSAMDADSVYYDYGDGSTGAEETHTYAASGVYTVCQIAMNACSSDSSCTEVSIMLTGIDQIPGLSALSVYPNPNQGTFQVALTLDQLEDFSLEVLTVRGKQVFQKGYGTVIGSVQESLELNELSKGIYFLRFHIGTHVHTEKLMIKE